MKPWDMVATPPEAAVFPAAAVLPAAAVFPAAPMFGHQGGWDEILLVVVPLALMAGLLAVANRRVKAKLAQQQNERDV
jgi:hypothetical protein